MDLPRIAELLEPFLLDASGKSRSLDAAQLTQISDYLELLLRWNAKISLTSVRDAENIVTRHFGESFFAAVHLFQSQSQAEVIDVGSGAGFPGLPLKIYAPGIALCLVESNLKKATFLKEALRTMAMVRASVFAGRAEDCDARAELVTLRAVEHFELALGAAANLVSPGGRLALLIGSAQVKKAIELHPEFSWDPPVLIPQSSQRVLLVGTKQQS